MARKHPIPPKTVRRDEDASMPRPKTSCSMRRWRRAFRRQTLPPSFSLITGMRKSMENKPAPNGHVTATTGRKTARFTVCRCLHEWV